MLGIANESKGGSLPVETDPFVGLQSDFLENQNVGLTSKMFQSTPGAGSSSNVQGSDVKRSRVGHFADAASFVWIKTKLGVGLGFRFAPDGAKKLTVLARFTDVLPAQPKF